MFWFNLCAVLSQCTGSSGVQCPLLSYLFFRESLTMWLYSLDHCVAGLELENPVLILYVFYAQCRKTFSVHMIRWACWCNGKFTLQWGSFQLGVWANLLFDMQLSELIGGQPELTLVVQLLAEYVGHLLERRQFCCSAHPGASCTQQWVSSWSSAHRICLVFFLKMIFLSLSWARWTFHTVWSQKCLVWEKKCRWAGGRRWNISWPAG